MTDGTKRIHADVHGLVQGVGFCAFTERVGRRLGLVGWVRNAPDGSVECEAEGAIAAVDEFLTAVHVADPDGRLVQVHALS